MKLIRYWTGNQYVTAFMGKAGRKRTPICYFDYPIRLYRVPNAEFKVIKELDYPLKRSIRKMLSFGVGGNITKGARDFLNKGLV